MVIGKYACHARCESLPGRYVKEFVWAMGIGLGPKNAGHQELHARKLLSQHAHEGNAATSAHVHSVSIEVIARGVLHG